MRRVIAALAAVIVSAACGGPGPSGAPSPEPDGNSSSDVDPASGFVLSVIVQDASVTVADEINVFATLGHDRPARFPSGDPVQA